MRVVVHPGSPRSVIVADSPFSGLEEIQLTVNLALVPLFFLVPDEEVIMYLCNRSVGAQNIRVGINPQFAPAINGFMLQANDAVTIGPISKSVVWNAIADGAGALLDRLIISKQVVL